jgi:hypothetical protein
LYKEPSAIGHHKGHEISDAKNQKAKPKKKENPQRYLAQNLVNPAEIAIITANEILKIAESGTEQYDYQPRLRLNCHSYAPLKSNGHTRVLILEPAQDYAAPLRCFFESGRLKDLQHKYEAISYTWGVSFFTHKLQYAEDGTEIPFTHNLDAALRRFRSKFERRSLWADAVCIDQSNEKEKAIQIPVMKEIYEAASRVLIWLGNGAQEEHAISVLCGISRGIPSFMAEEDETFEMELESSLGTIINLPYFSRRWIIQEAVSNIDMTLFGGENEISWERFSAAFKRVQGLLSQNAFRSTNLIPIYSLMSLWRWRALGEENHDNHTSEAELNILELMDKFEESECSDPRDRVYALVSLSKNVIEIPESLAIPAQWNRLARLSCGKDTGCLDSIPMIIDYSLPTKTIYQAFAASAIASGYGLNVLGAAALRKPRSRLLLPSWVPDWTATMGPKLQDTLRGNITSFQMASDSDVRICFPRYMLKGTVLLSATYRLYILTQEAISTGKRPSRNSLPFSISNYPSALSEKLLWPQSQDNV